MSIRRYKEYESVKKLKAGGPKPAERSFGSKEASHINSFEYSWVSKVSAAKRFLTKIPDVYTTFSHIYTLDCFKK
jgi:hypothetical protein